MPSGENEKLRWIVCLVLIIKENSFWNTVNHKNSDPCRMMQTKRTLFRENDNPFLSCLLITFKGAKLAKSEDEAAHIGW